MINPILEMKTETILAQTLNRDLKQTIKERRQSISRFCKAKEKSTIVAPINPKIEEKDSCLKEKSSNKPPLQIMVDLEKEKQLLKMAKEEYQSYADIAKFSERLNLRPGIVYLTLKHHNFIQQNETTQYRVLDAYYKSNGNLRGVTEITGLNVWICAKTLEQLGISPNWASYKDRAETGNLGDWAEEEFKKLVPTALDMNMQYQMNNPGFDFMVNGKTIDVKSSNIRKSRSSLQYAFRIRGENKTDLPDFFCLFLIKEGCKEPKSGNYNILLIPKEVLPEKNLSINISLKEGKGNSTMYWDFEVEPSVLHSILDEI